jgi:ribose transport system permease protein
MKRKFAPLVTLAVLLGACCAFNADFRSQYNLMNIARQVSYSGLLALGMTLVIAGGGIDLSVGSLLALSGVFGLQVMNALPSTTPEWAAFLAMALVALGVGVVGGALNGALVNVGGIPPFIATLGTFSIYRSLAVYSADAGLVQSSNATLNHIARGLGGTLPLLVLLAAALVIWGILRYTRFGWRVCAVGSNEKAAEYAAVNVKSVRFWSYAATGLLCGVGAVLLASRLQSVSSTGAGNAYELDAIACVIIGGTPMSGGRASIWGTLCGVFILGIIGNALDLWSISANLQGTVKGVIIILAVLLQYRTGRLGFGSGGSK